MNRRTWYGSAYLLLSAGILTAGFTSYAAVPEAAQPVVCVQSRTFLEEQNAAFMKEEIGKEISGESEEISGKMMAASVRVLDEKNQQEAEEAREREEKREQEREQPWRRRISRSWNFWHLSFSVRPAISRTRDK